MTNAPPPAWADPQHVIAAEIGPPGGFWIRFVAYLIDGLIVSVIGAVLAGILVAAVVLSGEPIDDSEDSPFIIVGVVVLASVLVVINWLYEALMTSSPRGATLGKQALDLRIVRFDGTQLSFGRATARHFLKVLITPLVPLFIGYLMAAFTARKRALHDVLADTLVIHADGFHQQAVRTGVPNAGAAVPPPVRDARRVGVEPIGYGGFWLRVIAYLIDIILLLIVSLIIGGFFRLGLIAAEAWDALRFADPMTGLVLSWLYFAFMESSPRGATAGKMAMGLRVVTDQGQPLSFANATGRYFAKYVSWIILGIGFIMVAFTDRKRGLHDMIAGTLVIKAR
jgi:uncharacterized RDD family membrane protein YckC